MWLIWATVNVFGPLGMVGESNYFTVKSLKVQDNESRAPGEALWSFS